MVTTDDYAVGAVALWESLRRTRPEHGLLVVVTKRVSEECERRLQKAGLRTLRMDEQLQRSHASKAALRHWDNTFSKLLMFELVEYEKIVYLDADMMVLRNLDHLFARAHLSAAVPDKLMPGHESWVQLCSALMVIEPQAGLAAAIMQHVPAVEARMKSFSDQDLLHEHFPDWPSHRELELEQGYGVFLDSIDRYIQKFGYNLNFSAPDERTIAAVHFVGSRKPWSWSRVERNLRLVKYASTARWIAVRMLREYVTLLRSAASPAPSAET
ncbi:MAG TPA: glycosyltransferase [Candidatus Bathyarchaeia archaeon]|nr:glycosyltransferase [Candidatus Bathyarchaeia archaeon]